MRWVGKRPFHTDGSFELDAILNVQLGTLQHFCANDTFPWANEPPGMANQFQSSLCAEKAHRTQLSGFRGILRAAIFEMGCAVVAVVQGVFACHREQFASGGCALTQYLF